MTPTLRSLVCSSALAFFCGPAHGQQPPLTAEPDAANIMARVAAHQDHADAERSHYLYQQHAHVVSRRGKTVMCEETTDSRITPSANGSDEQLFKLEGRLRKKNAYVLYTAIPKAKHGDHEASKDQAANAPAPQEGAKATAADHDADDVNITLGDDDMDRDLVENMRSNLIHDKSKDGIGAGLFPLTTKIQAHYLYHLAEREHLNGREVFHISFVPKDKDDYGWKGDAYIDTAAYQPVVVRTTMARRIPFAVRTLLGTNLPGFGFTVVYEPQSGGLWLPVSFGTEFKLHVLFFFNREIILNARNHDFEATHVHSMIVPAP